MWQADSLGKKSSGETKREGVKEKQSSIVYNLQSSFESKSSISLLGL